METITIEHDARGVAWLWLDRAEKHNALSAEMIAELHEAARILGADRSVRVVVLGARGRSFCAGGDLAWMRAQFDAAPATRAREAGALAQMLQALNTLPKPLIGRVQGNAFGGGIGMIAVCDVAIAVPGVTMALTETRLGLIPATIGPYVCARMGEGPARRVFLSGRRFDAAEGARLGLISEVVADDMLDQAVEAEIAPFLECAPEAVSRAKALLRRLGPPISEAEIAHSVAELVACWEGSEAQEGIGAFFDKRPPRWRQGG